MSQFDTSTANKPFTPEGCIAAIPTQSTKSCELVIRALAAKLVYVTGILGEALEVYIIDHSMSDEEREENYYWQGWNDANQALESLRRDWPHLDIPT